VAGGVAWARASFTTASVTIVKAWSLLSIMCPFRPQGLRINVGYTFRFLLRRGRSIPAWDITSATLHSRLPPCGDLSVTPAG
jgi:hypothetical protein